MSMSPHVHSPSAQASPRSVARQSLPQSPQFVTSFPVTTQVGAPATSQQVSAEPHGAAHTGGGTSGKTSGESGRSNASRAGASGTGGFGSHAPRHEASATRAVQGAVRNIGRIVLV